MLVYRAALQYPEDSAICKATAPANEDPVEYFPVAMSFEKACGKETTENSKEGYQKKGSPVTVSARIFQCIIYQPDDVPVSNILLVVVTVPAFGFGPYLLSPG